jgi:hypothetical protein
MRRFTMHQPLETLIEKSPLFSLHSITISAKPVEESYGIARVRVRVVAASTYDGEEVRYNAERMLPLDQFASRFEQVATMLVEDISRIIKGGLDENLTK